jgi:hypothetical protein
MYCVHLQECKYLKFIIWAVLGNIMSVVTGSPMPGMTFYNELMLKVMYGGDQMNE